MAKPLTDNRKRNRKTGLTAEGMERLRARLDVGRAITAINDAVAGKLDLSTSRYKACELVLRKNLPDLSAYDVNHNLGHDGSISFVWGPTLAAPADEPKTIDVTPERALQDQEPNPEKVAELRVIDSDPSTLKEQKTDETKD